MVCSTGINKQAVVAMVTGISEDPTKGACTFEASTTWKSGAIVETTFGDHTWMGDEPPQLLGTGKFLGPSDTLLHALSHGLIVTMARDATQRDIDITSMKVNASGIMNLQGFTGVNPKVKPGFQEIHLQLEIEAPTATSPEEIADLFKFAQKTSPVCQTVRRQVDLEWEFDIKGDSNAKPYTEQDDDLRHGVSFQGLKDTVALAQKDGKAVTTRFVTETTWQKGTAVETTIEKFELPVGTPHLANAGTRPHKVVGDNPTGFWGKNQGPNPCETLLHGMGNCIGVTQSYHSAVSGIRITDFKVDFKGEMDIQGMLDLDDNVSPGFSKIKAKVTARGSGDTDKLTDFYKQATKLAPICHSVSKPVHLTFGLQYNGKVIS